MGLEYPNITLGTAGHIDHGKTALIRFLTGCDTDRLKAEKERGMSIDLGFAPCTLGGLQVGIVDVPGHENFIKTMVAGAAAMDGVIFVVAADDGVMPQTREHLEILTLLGVEHGVVALTKIDRVEAEYLELVHEEVADYLRGTFLEGAPILGMNNLTGEGFEQFYTALADLVAAIPRRSVNGVFRLPVERAFSAAGYGTIVAGVPVSGSAKTGDDLVLLPKGTTGRIRGIEVYGREAEAVLAGQCAALNVRQWDSKTVGRGDVVAAPGYFEPGRWYVCRLRLLGHPGLRLETGEKVKFHTGTSETVASVYLIESDQVMEGQTCLAQVRTAEPIVAGPRDRFIIRSLSPAHTIGGGTIVEGVERRLRRTHPDVVEDLRRRAEAATDSAAFAEYCLRAAGPAGVTSERLAFRAKLPRSEAEQILQGLEEEGKALAEGATFLHADALHEAAASVADAVETYHREHPKSPGITRDALRESTGLRAPAFDRALSELTGESRLRMAGDRFALPEHKVGLTDEERAALAAVERVFRDAPFSPPGPADVAAGSGLPADRARWAFSNLIENGRLVQVEDGLVFHAEAVEEARRRLEDFLRREGRLESVKFKYLLDTSRKFAIPLLDYFDRIGVTSRVGHTRYLRGE
jgi:selenocysteine-specific elongation factor